MASIPGKRLYSFSEGDRAEDLAAYVLSAFSAVVPVRRQSDYGADLLCIITHRRANALYAGRAFEVQVKTVSESEITYGGLDDGKAWRDYELKWLYGQDQPFLVCLVNQKELNVRLYSTVRIWGARYQWGEMGEVKLVPNEQPEGVGAPRLYARTPIGNTYDGKVAGDGFSYQVPLGTSIMDISLGSGDLDDNRDTLRDCITKWIDLDYRNIRYFKMGIPCVEEPKSWEPNLPFGDELKVWHFSNETTDQNISDIVRSLTPGIAALVNNFKHQRQYEKITRIRPFSDLIKEYNPNDLIVSRLLLDVERKRQDN